MWDEKKPEVCFAWAFFCEKIDVRRGDSSAIVMSLLSNPTTLVYWPYSSAEKVQLTWFSSICSILLNWFYSRIGSILLQWRCNWLYSPIGCILLLVFFSCSRDAIDFILLNWLYSRADAERLPFVIGKVGEWGKGAARWVILVVKAAVTNHHPYCRSSRQRYTSPPRRYYLMPSQACRDCRVIWNVQSGTRRWTPPF